MSSISFLFYLLTIFSFFPNKSKCFTSAFGSGNSNTNYTMDLISQFTPNAGKKDIKCSEIPNMGFPIKVVSILEEKLSQMFNPNVNNMFVRMFFYEDNIENKDRYYKYGIEVRSFTERIYIAIKLSVKGSGSSSNPDELFLMTKNPQLLSTVLSSSKIDLSNMLGCGDLKSLYQQASGCLLYTSPSPRDLSTSRMPSSA